MADATESPVRPKAVVASDDVGQPRRVEWGHLRQTRGVVAGDTVRIERQHRIHRFRGGVHERGSPRVLFEAPLDEALTVYRALDALFDGGVTEVGWDG